MPGGGGLDPGAGGTSSLHFVVLMHPCPTTQKTGGKWERHGEWGGEEGGLGALLHTKVLPYTCR